MTINLLPEKLKQERKIRKLTNFTNMALVAIFLLFILFYFVFQLIKIQTNDQISSLTNKIETEKITIKRFESTENSIAEINSRLTKINTISKSKPLLSLMLQSIANSAPSNLSVNSLSIDSTKNILTISGTASSRTEIAVLKEKLESTDQYENVVFNTSVYNKENQDYTFALTAELIK